TRTQPNRGPTLTPRPYIPPENLPPVHLVPIEQLERDLQEARRQQYNARNRYESTLRKPWLAHWVDTRRFEMRGYNNALVTAHGRLDERLEHDAQMEAERAGVDLRAVRQREQARVRARLVEEGREREPQVEAQRAEHPVREREQAELEAQRGEAERPAREREQARAQAQWEERQEHNAQMEAQRYEDRRAREQEEAWARAEFEAMFFQPVAQPQRQPYAHNHRWIQRLLGDRNMAKALSFVFHLVLGVGLGVLLRMLLPAPLGSGSLQRYILRVLR
ncbi:hypothetical protein DFP72DRAFT_1130456, partial [Ephemerocybe angulata]